MSDDGFIMLDIMAKRRGGVAKLNYGEQITYIKSGIKEGYLTKEKAYRIAKEINIENDSMLTEYFKGLDLDSGSQK